MFSKEGKRMNTEKKKKQKKEKKKKKKQKKRKKERTLLGAIRKYSTKRVFLGFIFYFFPLLVNITI